MVNKNFPPQLRFVTLPDDKRDRYQRKVLVVFYTVLKQSTMFGFLSRNPAWRHVDESFTYSMHHPA